MVLSMRLLLTFCANFAGASQLVFGDDRDGFYSAAALLAMQSAVIPTAIPSVGPSVRLSHAGTLSRRMNIGSRGLHCEVAKHTSFLLPTMVGGRRPLPPNVCAQSGPSNNICL